MLISFLFGISFALADPFMDGINKLVDECSNSDERNIQEIKWEIENRKKELKRSQGIEAEINLLLDKLHSIKSLQLKTKEPVILLDELAVHCPEKIQLSAVSETDGRVKINGVAASNPDISKFLTNLEKSAFFNDVYLNSIEQVEKDGVRLKEFSMTSRFTIPLDKYEKPSIPPKTGSAPPPIETRCEELATVHAELAQINRKLENLRDAEVRMTGLNAEFHNVIRSIPTTSELPDLLTAISTTGRKSGLNITKLNPLPETSSRTNEYVAEVPIQLAVEGSYHEIAIFFDKISRMDRIIHTRNIDIEIEKENNSNVVLLVEATLLTYRVLSDTEHYERRKKTPPKKRYR